jgi:glycogen(starch) synthase
VHILLVTYEFPPFMATGGIGSYMYHLAHLMAGKGHQVTVFSATHSHSEVTILRDIGYTNYLIPAVDISDFRMETLNVYDKYVYNQQIDLIESPEVGACALLIKQTYPQIPLLVRLHTPGVVITRFSQTYVSIFSKLRFVVGALRRGKVDLGYWSKIDLNRDRDPEYQICLLADKLISPSKSLGEYISRFWLINKKIHQIPNPFCADEDLFMFPIGNREKVICFVGKLTVLKGLFALTKALKVILKRHPDYRVVFAGRDEVVSKTIPSMRAWMQSELKEVGEKVEFTGVLSRDEVKTLIGKCRICVVPSLWENYPTVILEAMAGGAAVVAANIGGIPEMVTNGETGYLIDPQKHKEIVRVLSHVISAESERQEVVIAAKEWVRRSQQEIEFRLIEFYLSLVDNG